MVSKKNFKTSSFFRYCLITGSLLVASVSCWYTNAITPTILATFTPAFIEPTQTLTVSPSPVPSITLTLLPTHTQEPSPTSSPTSTSTATPEPPIVFAVIGDYGEAGTGLADVARLIDSWNVNFIITTGDNNYPNGLKSTIDANIGQYFHQYISPYYGGFGEGADINRFFPTLGNHDWYAINAQPYLDYFTLPGNERYYDFSWGKAHFFALDSDTYEPDGVGKSSDQAQWLKVSMAQSDLPLKFIYFHHAPYSSSSVHGSIDWMRWPFQEWGATAVFSGHDHTYERLEIDGIPYFVVGLSGNASHYDFGKPLMQSMFRFRDDYGAMRVTIDADWIVYEFITRSGEVIDTLRWFIGRGF